MTTKSKNVRKVTIVQSGGDDLELVNLSRTTATVDDVAAGKQFFTKRGELAWGSDGSNPSEDEELGTLYVKGNGTYIAEDVAGWN
jgi:hypothetical protein